jgi:hypothetical protein
MLMLSRAFRPPRLEVSRARAESLNLSCKFTVAVVIFEGLLSPFPIEET